MVKRVIPDDLIPDVPEREDGPTRAQVRTTFRKSMIEAVLREPDFCRPLDTREDAEKTVEISGFRLHPDSHQALIERLSERVGADTTGAKILLDPAEYDLKLETNKRARDYVLGVVRALLPDGLFDSTDQRKAVRTHFLREVLNITTGIETPNTSEALARFSTLDLEAFLKTVDREQRKLLVSNVIEDLGKVGVARDEMRKEVTRELERRESQIRSRQ